MVGFTYKNTKAFTLAETLISLVVIGIAAALVIPSVLKNYNDRKYNTARLKALKTFGEAGKMASINGEINGQPSARAFVENVLSKYLKIVKVCDNNKVADCNFPTTFKSSSGSKITSNNIKTWKQIGSYNGLNDETMSTIISTSDGFSAKIFYNPNCGRTSREVTYVSNCKERESCDFYSMNATCMNAIYDMNGTKAPNHVGKDIGIVTVFWSGIQSTTVAPGIMPYADASAVSAEGKSWSSAKSLCASKGTSRVVYDLPTIYEIMSLYINKELASLGIHNYWSNSFSAERRKYYYLNLTNRRETNSSGAIYPYCVRR